jgi:AAA family ATP:ADP antiporter
MTKSIRDSVREILWPIYGIEHKKFLPIAFMMFCILFNYCLLRSVKDGFIVTAIGSEALGFLKTYLVFPSAIVVTAIYSALCQYIDSKKVFYIFAAVFISYFAFFTYVLFPNLPSYVIAQDYIDSLIAWKPAAQWFFRIYQNWTYASFYVVAELWGSMMLSLFFWQLANQVTRPSEAKRFYAMFGFLGNLGYVLAGYLLTTLLDSKIESDAAAANFMFILSLLVLSAVVMVALYGWVQCVVATDPLLVDHAAQGATTKKKKAKLGFWASMKVIFSSRYLALITALILCYGISTILIEGVWKDRIKALYPTKEGYTAFMGSFMFYQGLVAMVFMLVGANILRLVSWTTAAIITPMMLLVTGFFFFLFIFASKSDAAIFAFVAVSNPLMWAVMIGSIQGILTKATKYSLFDPTQKMAYMPLSDDLKTKGMSAVEVIGGRLGKMGGGVILSTIFMVFPSYTFAEVTPILAVLCGIMVLTWIYSVRVLGHEYEAAMAAQQHDAVAAK